MVQALELIEQHKKEYNIIQLKINNVQSDSLTYDIQILIYA